MGYRRGAGRRVAVLRFLELLSIVALLAVSGSVMSASDSTPYGGFYDARLRSALAKGSLVELEEIGTNLPSGALSGALSSTHREVALGAVAAARRAPDNWRYLAPLAARAGGADRPLATLAAEVALAVVRDLDGTRVAEWDIAAHELDLHREAWESVAEASGHYADVRVRALEVIAGLVRWSVREPVAYEVPGTAGAEVAPERGTPVPGPSASQFAATVARATSDPDPEVRRAAFELWPAGAAAIAQEPAARALADDPDPDVALAAAQLLCPWPGASERAFTDARGAMGEAGRARLVALLKQAAQTPDARSPAGLLHTAQCLAQEPTESVQKALRALAETGPETIRPAVRRLLLPTPAGE